MKSINNTADHFDMRATVYNDIKSRREDVTTSHDIPDIMSITFQKRSVFA